MPLLSSSIPNLINGVSQQAADIRLASELEAQLNAFSSIVEGLGKRSPSKHIAKLTTANLSPALLHLINRDATERYQVVVTNGDIQVFDLAGNEQVVNFESGSTDYILTSNPKRDLKALTVADYTFIVNTTVEASMDPDLSEDHGVEGLVYVRQGQYGTNYKVYIDGFTAASFTTSADDVTDLKTSNIMSELKSDLSTCLGFDLTTATWDESSLEITQTGAFTSYTWSDADRIYITGGTGVTPGIYIIAAKDSNNTITLTSSISTGSIDLNDADITSSTGWNLDLQDSTLWIRRKDQTDFSLRVADTFGDRCIFACKDAVNRFIDLPTVAPANFKVKINGDNSLPQDDYWVKFVCTNSTDTFDKGVWVETVAPGITYQPWALTMPHVLVREANGTFTFRTIEWEGREAGDESTNPDPSFIGHTINDVFFFKNRLGLLSGENCILSEASGFFNFFATTVTTLLDSDPVDVAATHTKPATLKYALPFREQLLLFSDLTQFVLSTNNNLITPSSLPSIDPTTELACSLEARPVGAGTNAYFAFPRGDFSGLREYFVDPANESKDAADITSHVPKYIQGTIRHLSAATTEDVITVVTDDTETPEVFYIYKYYWLNNQKLQSSWSKYSFEEGSQVLSSEFIQSTAYLVVQRDDGAYLESMDFSPGQTDEDSDYVTALDRRLDETQTSVSYDESEDLTEWVLPYTITGSMKIAVRAGDEDYPEGYNIQIQDTDGTKLYASGDLREAKVYIGQTYEMDFTLSEQVLKEEAKGGGQAVIEAGRLQIRYFTLGYSNSGFFETMVTPEGRDPSIKIFTGFVLGVDSPGQVNLSSGKFRFPVYCKSSDAVIRVTNDSYLPCHFVAAEWEGTYVTRSQRA